MARGGRRPGAGRKGGSKNSQLGVEYLDDAADLPSGPPTREEQNRSPEDITRRLIEKEYAELARDGFTPATQRRLGLEALACMRAHAIRGNLKAARYMLQSFPPLPEQSWFDKTAGLEPDELEGELTLLLGELKAEPAVVGYILSLVRTAEPPVQAAPDGTQLFAPYVPGTDQGGDDADDEEEEPEDEE